MERCLNPDGSARRSGVSGGTGYFLETFHTRHFIFGGLPKKTPFPPGTPFGGLEPEATNKIRTDVFQLGSAIHTDVVTVLTQYPSEFNKALVGGR